MEGNVKASVFLSTALLAAVFASSCWTTNNTINIGNTVTCTKPIEINGDLAFPCGKCMSCRVQRTQEWSIRLIHEKTDWDHSIFVTLTYSDEKLPTSGKLQKTDLQKFLKRLRKFYESPIKYYASGEYGEKYGRPHYHLIIFGMSPEDKPLIEKAWNQGLVHVGTVTLESCRYVASYIQKKQNRTGNKEEDLFSLQSCGLGLAWSKRNESYLKSNERITHKGIPMGIPRYYVKKLGLDLSKSQNERVEKVNEELRQVKNQNNDVELFDLNLQSKVQADKNITARTSLKEKKL